MTAAAPKTTPLYHTFNPQDIDVNCSSASLALVYPFRQAKYALNPHCYITSILKFQSFLVTQILMSDR